MVSAVEQVKGQERKAAPIQAKKYTGEVVYIYAFDVAYEMTRQPVRELPLDRAAAPRARALR